MSAALAFKISPENLMADWGNFESWSLGTSVAPDGWSMAGTAGSVARESTEIKFGTYAMKIISGSSGQYAAEYRYDFASKYFDREGEKVLASNHLPGRTITFGMWVKCSTASKARIYINDGTTRTNSSYHTGGGGWEFLTVEAQIGANATYILFGAEVASSSITAYFDGGIVCDGELTFTDFRGSNIYVRGEDFGQSVTYSVGSFTIPRRDGTQIQNVFMRDGKIRFRVQIHNTSFSAARAAFDTIIRAVSDGVKDLMFADDRIIKVRLSNFPKLDIMAEGQVYVFDIVFTASIPASKFINMTRSHQAVTSSPSSFNVEVLGSLKTLPIVYFLPSAITLSSCVFENLTTGERFSFTDSLAVGGTLKVDCDAVEVLKNGVDGLSYFSGDFMRLVPGTNYMKFTGTAGITINMDWVDTYL